MNQISNLLRSSICNLAFGDLMLFIYLAVAARQYLWPFNNNLFAWTASLLIAAALCYLRLTTRENITQKEDRNISFWLIVILPLSIFFIFRVAFPDTIFDVMHYHIFNAERALRGAPLLKDDLFPALPINPLPDMVMGIFRHIFGYRLGTVGNLFIFIWLSHQLDDLLKRYINIRWQRYSAIAFILLNEGMLWELDTYLVDLIALPLLLEATIIALDISRLSRAFANIAYLALLLGLSLAFKLTNIVFVMPIACLSLYKMYLDKLLPSKKQLLIAAMIFIAPILPYTILITWQTLSPIFPYYNKFLRSPYWPLINFKDYRYGPLRLRDVFIWPILIFFQPQRTTELTQITYYAGHISLGYLLAIILFLRNRLNRDIGALSLIFISSSIAWSLSGGNCRYGFYLELLGGILIVYFSAMLGTVMAKSSRQSFQRLRALLLPLCLILLVIKLLFSINYAIKLDWAARPTLIDNPDRYFSSARLLLRDYALKDYLSANVGSQVDMAEIWLASDQSTNGYATLLRPDIPVINCQNFFIYLGTDRAINSFAQTINRVSEKKIISIVAFDNLKVSLDNIRNCGFSIGRITPAIINNYFEQPVELIFIEILPPQSRDILSTLRREAFLDIYGHRNYLSHAPKLRLDATMLKADISAAKLPTRIKAGAKEIIHFNIKNKSEVIWPSDIHTEFPIYLGNHWFDETGKELKPDDGNTPLMIDLPVGSEIILPLAITAPVTPGNYKVEIELSQRDRFWFKQRANSSFTFNIKVD